MAKNPQVIKHQVSQTSKEGDLCWRVKASDSWKPTSYFQGLSDVRPGNHQESPLFLSL